MPDTLPEDKSKRFYRARGSSGLGTLVAGIVLGIAALAAASLALELTIATPIVLAVGGALGLMGSGLYLAQDHKERVNDQHARRAYKQHEGYHHETERVLDQSLLHLMKGPADLPERAEYIERNYGIKPLTPHQFRGGKMGTGMAIGVGIGLLVAAGVAAVTAPFSVPVAAALGPLFGILAGGTATMVKSATDMKSYERYLDRTAKQGQWELAHKVPEKKPEYENVRVKAGTFAGDIAVSRVTGPTTVQYRG